MVDKITEATEPIAVTDKVNELISTEKKITIRYQIQYSPSDNDEVLNTTASRTIELK